MLSAFLFFFPNDIDGWVAFALMAATAELMSVELFLTSRKSTVSVSGIVALAGIVSFGPLAGALIHLSSGIAATVHSFFDTEHSEQDRAGWFQKFAFNTGMWVIGSTGAGVLYVELGGSVGTLNWATSLIPLILAAAADIGINLIILIGVIALQSGRRPLQIWRQDFEWTVPVTLAGSVLGGGILALAYGTFGIGGLLLTFLPVGATGYAFRLYADNIRGYVSQLETANQQLDKVNRDLLKTLGAIIDADDMYTYGHSNQVTLYAQAIGKRMGLPADQLELLTRGGLVHDLGKIGVPDNIVSKPGRLTDDEFDLMKRHTVIGAEIVSQMQGLQDLTPLVRHHHERWDGRGYPDGLKGESIPLLARVLCVADSVEAMLSDRPYRPTRGLEEVIEEVERSAGSHFDPEIAKIFVSLAREEGGSLFTNNAGDIAEVLTSHGISGALANRCYVKRSNTIDSETCSGECINEIAGACVVS
ncbi:MAG: HD-GYP domain-containing protein [Caldilineaceae bacterium]|nr:HD-GYP domain-containing protein [Caldilineaceae bacterium]